MNDESADSAEQMGKRFPELDEAARRRAEARMADGAEAQSAFAQESVMLHMVRAYN
jgi:hypothetical protein